MTNSSLGGGVYKIRELMGAKVQELKFSTDWNAYKFRYFQLSGFAQGLSWLVNRIQSEILSLPQPLEYSGVTKISVYSPIHYFLTRRMI